MRQYVRAMSRDPAARYGRSACAATAELGLWVCLSGEIAGRREDREQQPLTQDYSAYLRLIDQRRVNWSNRAHFFAVASQIMRRILVDYARSREYAKRGGDALKVPVDEGAVIGPGPSPDLVALDKARTRLAFYKRQLRDG